MVFSFSIVVVSGFLVVFMYIVVLTLFVVWRMVCNGFEWFGY